MTISKVSIFSHVYDAIPISTLNPPLVGDQVLLNMHGQFTVSEVRVIHSDRTEIHFSDRPNQWSIYPSTEQSNCWRLIPVPVSYDPTQQGDTEDDI
jgi:hypothetical protein